MYTCEDVLFPDDLVLGFDIVGASLHNFQRYINSLFTISFAFLGILFTEIVRKRGKTLREG